MIDPALIIDGLVARGIPRHAAIGIAGNIAVESNFNPGINEIAPVVPGSRGGYGLIQWTGPRRRQFEDYAQTRGVAFDDLNTQLDFLNWELQNTERRAADRIFAAQTPEEAARLTSELFLRPGIPHLDRRIAETQRLAGNYQPGTGRAPTRPQNALAQPGMPQPPQNNALAGFAPAAMGQRQDALNALSQAFARPVYDNVMKGSPR
jgi:hypothetical protein